MKPSLCLNMIVRNESARIERALRSAAPYIKAIAILDTGSTDGTPDLIRKFAIDNEIACRVHDGEFRDFSQARNDAWRMARKLNGEALPFCQFALLMDADMELIVDDPAAFANLDANALSYDMMQKAGAISYGNRRIVNLAIDKDIYTGVTHEYIDVSAAGLIGGARFHDHADGSNRADKFSRDARLLEEDLRRDPNNARSWFYLANTYRDWGKPSLAGIAYKRRLALGGWDEEMHNARMNLATIQRSLGNDDGFVAGMVDAYRMRPRRAEPLYDLARYFREKGDTAAALLFAKTGLDIPRPNDLLFVNDFVYSHGLRYEFAIAGYYSEADRSRAFEITDALALDPTCDPAHRWSARSNLFWYTKSLSEHCPSMVAYQLGFAAPDNTIAMNPSVECHDGDVTCNIRCVNYRIDEHGRYIILDGGSAIRTRNFLVRLDPETMATSNPRELIWSRPAPKYDQVIGLEDVRLWRFGGDLHVSATVRERSPHGTCQIAVGKVEDKINEVVNWRIVSEDLIHEKNWMPVPTELGRQPRFMYRLDTLLELGTPNIVRKKPSNIYPTDISGSSQLIPFNDGYLCVTHEASNDPRTGKRTYWHRFVWFNRFLELRRISIPFVFFDRQIEFCAGLAQLPSGRLIVSFGVRDAEAWVATLDATEVSHMLWKFHE